MRRYSDIPPTFSRDYRMAVRDFAEDAPLSAVGSRAGAGECLPKAPSVKGQKESMRT